MKLTLPPLSLPLSLSTIAATVDAFTGSSPRLLFSRMNSNNNDCGLSAVREATFGMGCFWAPSEELLNVEGVIDTTVGYTGNPKASSAPTYDSVCYGRDWVEGVRVEYDDERVSYPELLEAFFYAQEPRAGSRQYASIIFPHDEEQRKTANSWLSENKERKREVDGIPSAITSIEPLSAFYQAEGYHQRYWQKTRPRILAAIALIALMSATNPRAGGGDGTTFPNLSEGLQSLVHRGAETGFFLGAVYVLLERVFDRKVVEL